MDNIFSSLLKEQKINLKEKFYKNVFCHKLTKKGKVEVCILLSTNKSGSIINSVVKNISKFELINTGNLDSSPILYLLRVQDKKSNSSYTEVHKAFIKYKNSIFQVRTYKIVGSTYTKTEVTGNCKNKKFKCVLDDSVELLNQLTEGVKKSILPWRLHHGVDMVPVEYIYNKYL